MITYTRSKDLHPCRLDRTALIELLEIIKSDFQGVGSKDDFRISTSFDGININEDSLQNFLQHKNLPKVLTELSINQYDRSTNRTVGIDHIQLRFTEYAVTLYVTGTTESMVRGMFSQIIDFLRKKRPFFWFFRTPPLLIIQGGLFVIIITGFIVLFVRLYYQGFDSFGISLFIGLVIMSLLEFTMFKYPYAQINLKEKKSFIENHITLITILGLLSGLVGTIITIISFVHQLNHP